MESEEERKPAKRTHSEYAAQDGDAGAAAGSEDGSLDDDGPTAQLPSSEARPKKRRVLPFERLYSDALPRGTRYSRSLMHKDQLSFLTLTAQTDFLITSSVDGMVKFWKKVAQGIEYVKEIRAHEGAVVSVSASADGRSYASAGADGLIRIFDVITFDLLATITLASAPGCICWTHKKGASLPLLAVGEESSPLIHIFDGRGDRQAPIHTIKGLHKSPVAAMAFNDTFDCVVSADRTGMIEYWRPSGSYEKPDNVFEYKSSTDLFDLKKAKSAPCCITISPSGHRFAVLSLPDQMIRIFDFATAKLYRTYDESLRALEDIQQAGTHKLEPIEFGRRIALEREVGAGPMGSKGNVVFDESGHFIVYGSMLGAKVLNTYTNRVMRIYGKDDNLRILNVAIYQGAPQKKGVTTIEMGASSNPLLQESEACDPILVATAAGKQRFYMFTNDEAVAKSSTRDVQNEKPAQAVVAKKARAEPKKAETGTAAIVHTTFGDIQIRLYPGFAPKAVENFVTHSRKGYYNGTIFHRVIRKFMLQCGDPLGDGTGGESIWGKEFADEFSTLKHDKPYTVSMANAGPNTNGSQFFITTEVTPWLDGRHTIFGRATQGLDVIHKIESVKTHKDKPIEDIKIISIDVI